MPPVKTVAKKAAKKAAKKSAKKAAGHHHDKHHQTKEMRRAYEHMGRLEILRTSLKSSAEEDVAKLAKLAQRMIGSGYNKDAADLLRAAEHLGFAHLAGEVASSGQVSTELEESIAEHFEELTRRADEHWNDEHSIVAALYKDARRSASKAFKQGAYHEALEYARAAEALSHVKQDRSLKLGTGKKALQLGDA